MQKFIILLLSVFVFMSCAEDKKEIEFSKITDVDLGNLSKENAKLKANAVFVNLSDKEFEVKEMVLEFSVDGKNIGTIVTKTSKKIAAKGEFSIPFQYNYDTEPLVLEGHDPSSQYQVEIKGDLTVKNSAGEEITTAVKYSGQVAYLTKKEIRQEKREERQENREDRKKDRETKKAERKAKKDNN